MTGAAKGLGATISRTLAAAGYPQVVHYRHSKAEASEVVKACQELGTAAESLQGDFASPEEVDSFIRRYQERYSETVNLIYNVGNYLVAPPSETKLDDWMALFQVNVHASFALFRALLPSLKKQKGTIVTIGVAGLNRHYADLHAGAYSATKMALLSLTRSLARELAPSGISVNMVSPGYLENAVDLPTDTTTLPMKRAAELQEVARMVAYLVDPANRYITGQNIEVAGGTRL